ncbi:hypothetical protein GA0061101_1192 [Rhizobium lusitanum]|uniref:Uncharacterized protein n=1 Tax=Rhizobium lusitanum TaxID=293958 RepID=A0A1C3WXB9_9HYPH|nr:hypothetical protein GA0061101_1192 [Rhizobium lusitanum]
MNHREEVFGEFVVAGGDAPEVFELAEEAFDQITLAIEPLAEAWLPFAIGFGWDVGHCVLGMDFGRETTSGATETMISIPLLAVAAC